MSFSASFTSQETTGFKNFSLVLMVNHACNLRCTYCYTGKKFHRPMSPEIGRNAIEAAVRSMAPDSKLQLGFFGGEPLLEAERIQDWMRFARDVMAHKGIVAFDLTTNGTIESTAAWDVLLSPDMRVCVSCDGDMESQNHHRRFATGDESSAAVMKTLGRLVSLDKEFAVVSVVRPDNLDALPHNVNFLHTAGVREINLSLDLWTRWTRSDLNRLQTALTTTALYWRSVLPGLAINWFDEKLGVLARIPTGDTTARCGFGVGEIAVAPSGNLYPCERLIGEDKADNPMRLFGHVSGVRDFLNVSNAPERGHTSCSACALNSSCSTSCRCSNYVRTGDASKPDGLLCALDRICTQAVREVFQPTPLNNRSYECTPR